MRFVPRIPDECLSVCAIQPLGLKLKRKDLIGRDEKRRTRRYGDGGKTEEDHEGSGKTGGTASKSGARRAGQPRPGAPGSRPRFGSAADLLSFLHCVCFLSGSGHFFFAAPSHYPLKQADAKRLRMH